MIKNYLYYSVKILKRNRFMTVISVVQIAVSIVLLNFCVGAVSGVFSQLKFAKGFDCDSLYVVQANEQLDDDQYTELDEDESDKLTENIIDGYCEEMGLNYEKGSLEYYSVYYTYDCMIRWYNQNKEKLGITGDIHSLYDKADEIRSEDAPDSDSLFGTTSIQFVPTEFNGYNVCNFDIIDDKMAQLLNFNILKGINLSDTNNTSDTIEAIAYGSGELQNDIKIGDTFDISIFNFTSDEYETKKVVIKGILDSPCYLLDSYKGFEGDNGLNLDSLITRYDFDSSDYNSDDYKEFFLLIKPWDGFNFDAYSTAYNSQYYLDLSNSSADIAQLEKDYAANGYEFASVKTAYDNSKEDVIQTVSSDTVTILMSAIMTLVTLFGISVIFIHNNKSLHIILRLNGATTSDSSVISLMNIIWILIAGISAAAVYLLAYNKYKHTKYSELFGIVIGKENVIATLIFTAAVICLFIPIIWKLHSDMREDR